MLTALAVIVFLFPDVLFQGNGSSQTSQFMGAFVSCPTKQFYKQPPHRLSQHAYADGGGALWQSEPAQQFLANCLRENQSPYWNPYSGAGQLGPETLVDLKLSFQSVLLSLLGGSQKAFDAVLIGMTYAAVTFLYLFFVRFMNLTTLSAVGGCFVFALNGYSTSTQGSNTAQTYCYFPMLLYCLSSFSLKPSSLKYVCIFAIDAIILSTTFLPTTFLVLLTTHSVAFGTSIDQDRQANRSGWRRRLTVLGIQTSALLLALMSMSFVYIPILESFQYVDAVSMYSARVFYPANFWSYLSLFSPKHFWEEYGACPPILWSDATENHGVRITSNMYHFGAIASMIVACAINRHRRLSATAIVCFSFLAISLGRVFAVPIISQIVELTPGIRSLGEQYWFSSTSVSFCILSALGLEAILHRRVKSMFFPSLMFATIIATIAFLASTYGFPEPQASYKRLCVSVLITFVVVGILCIGAALRFEKLTTQICWLLIITCTGELVFDTMFSRSRRYDFFKRPPATVKFLKDNCGLHRVANFGMGALPAEEGSAFCIPQIETMNMNILPTYEAFFHKHFLKNRMTNWGRFCTFFLFDESKHFVGNAPINLPMMNLCGIKYIVAMPATKSSDYLQAHGCKDVFSSTFWHIFQSLHVYPRAFMTPFVSSQTSNLAENIDDCARHIAFSSDKELLEDCRRLSIPEATRNWTGSASQIAKDSVEIVEYHHTEVVIETNAAKPAVLVLTDNWHPNWSATLDGKPVHLGLVDETFRGTAVPAGRHEIVMKYQPRTYTGSLILSAVAFFLALLTLVFGKKLDATLNRLF